MSELILLCRPEEMDETRNLGYRTAYAAWRIGDDGRLWRRPLPKLNTGSLMAIFGGHGKISVPEADIASECTRLGIGEVLWLSTLKVPSGKGYKAYLPRSSAISGGSLAQYLRGETDVFVEPLRYYFSLPDRKGEGVAISEKQMKEFAASAHCPLFSKELGCNYLLWEGGCVLYDDPESIGRKIELLSDLGVKRIILPYGSERVKAFLRSRC